MNDLTPLPRHRQAPISFRSDLAARLLAELTRDGRSQAQLIEEGLKLVAARTRSQTVEERNARIDAIVLPGHGFRRRSQQEVDDEIYDEFGIPR